MLGFSAQFDYVKQWLAARLRARSAVSHSQTSIRRPLAPLPDRKDVEHQWACATSVIVHGQATVSSIFQRQLGAAAQIDAAAYALQRLRDELIPALGAINAPMLRPAPTPAVVIRPVQFVRRERRAA